MTAFVCAACDGEIAPEEVTLVRDLTTGSDLFGDIDVEKTLNGYIEEINSTGTGFINKYLEALKTLPLTMPQQLNVIKVAVDMIEADGKILYSEVKFFKRLRSCLNIDDDAILQAFPDKEDYLLPDINVPEFTFDDNIKFAEINLKMS